MSLLYVAVVCVQMLLYDKQGDFNAGASKVHKPINERQWKQR